MKRKSKFRIYSELPSEAPNPSTGNIDSLPLRKILEKINDEDAKVPAAVRKAIPSIAKAAKAVSASFLSGGKIFFAGAGTSGRLAVIEAAELIPTFGVENGRFETLIAGGKKAVFAPMEGAEDDEKKGFSEIISRAAEKDTVVGIAASGITPYVRGVLKAAAKKKSKTVLITTNPRGPVRADIEICVRTGPEAISGSTRMKAGTATKLVLNMLTASAMIISGKVYGNWMVDLRPTSQKLFLRARRITAAIAGISPARAERILKKTKYDVKAAIVSAKLGISPEEAEKLLKKHGGFLRKVFEAEKRN